MFLPRTAATDNRGMPAKRVRRRILVAVLVIVLVPTGLTAVEYYRNSQLATVHSTTANAVVTGEVDVLRQLEAGGTVGVHDLDEVAAFVEGRNDGSDFRLVTLLRILYSHERVLSRPVLDRLRDLLVGFRYWMDEPGVTPAAYWTENHQIIFAADEFLAGQRFPTARFSDGRTGAQHRAAALGRISFWLEQRWRFGFSEWNSHYYGQDIAALSNLIDFSHDTDVVRGATIVQDLLFFDMASQSFHGTFTATSGRLYGKNKEHGDEGIDRIMAHAFAGADVTAAATGIEINFLLSGYRVPPVLLAIAHDPGDAVITSSTGRDLGELAHDASLTDTDRRVMAYWGMEAFTNPETIEFSMEYIQDHDLFANPFLAGFRKLNYSLLTLTGALPAVSEQLDLPTNGTALTRANTYTFRTADFSMYTAQEYRAGGFGNQESVFGMTLDDGVTLFHTHPAVLPDEPPPNGNSPGYWTGNGRIPLSCQDGAVNLSLYRLPEDPGYGRAHQLTFTHLYAPLPRFDRVVVSGRHLFLRYGNALVAVTAANPLTRHGDDEIVQHGADTYWVTEASSTRSESFEEFVDRVRGASATLDGGTLSYRSKGRTMTASFGTGCAVDGTPLRTSYPRHGSAYATVRRDPSTYRIEFGGHALTLDFARRARVSH